MRSRLLAVILAAGLHVPSVQASDRTGEAPPATPPVSTVVTEPAAGAPAAPATSAEPQPAVPVVADKPTPPAPPSLIVKINLSQQRMDVFAHGVQVHSWPISSGRSGFETPRGTFRAQWAAKMWYSRKYDMAPMPHAVFINGGVAVHATSAVGLLGRPASHGCIRLSPSNAATFYNLAHKHGLRQTQVSVFGSAPAARIAEPRQRPQGPGSQRVRVTGNGTPLLLPANAAGMFRLKPGSPYYGAASFEHNGVRYVRVR